MENESFIISPRNTCIRNQHAPMYFEGGRPTTETEVHAWKVASTYQDEMVFNRIRAHGFACYEAVEIAMDHPDSPKWYRKLPKKYEQFAMVAKLGAEVMMQGVPNSGQWLFGVRHPGAEIYTVVDIACYLFDMGIEQMPIVTGRQLFIEQSLSEIYSDHQNQQMNVQILKMQSAREVKENKPWHSRY